MRTSVSHFGDRVRHWITARQGIIGMANNCDWREPLTDSDKNREAAARALEFYLGWFADPLYKGDYPDSMRDYVGARLPLRTILLRGHGCREI